MSILKYFRQLTAQKNLCSAEGDMHGLTRGGILPENAQKRDLRLNQNQNLRLKQTQDLGLKHNQDLRLNLRLDLRLNFKGLLVASLLGFSLVGGTSQLQPGLAPFNPFVVSALAAEQDSATQDTSLGAQPSQGLSLLTDALNQRFSKSTANATSAAGAGSSSLIIQSNTQELQSLPNGGLRSVFAGNVRILHRGKLSIRANRIAVSAVGKKRVITATGSTKAPIVIANPSIDFYMEASEISFDVGTQVLTAINAKATYRKNQLRSAKITFNARTNSVQAVGSANRQVETIIGN